MKEKVEPNDMMKCENNDETQMDIFTAQSKEQSDDEIVINFTPQMILLLVFHKSH